MKKILLMTGVMALSLVSYTAMAKDNVQDETSIQHYEGVKIANSAEAIDILKSNNAKIAAILKADTASDSDLESIHEISYSLENAIDKMIADKAAEQSKLDAVDEAVQAIHHASENHEEAKTREWFAKLETSVAALEGQEDANAIVPAAGSVEDGVYKLVIKDHKFTPTEIRIPAGEKVKLLVANQDSTPEEFESDDFRREKIIAGNSEATIFVGPLKKGEYKFFGEFNLDTAQGVLIAE